jgi:hypothetical protein
VKHASTQRHRWLVVWGIAAILAAIGATACGSNDDEEPSTPPEFDAPKIACGEMGGDDIDAEVVREVSVTVTDAERDLAPKGSQLCGTLNGLPIALGDPDGDGVFEWTPSKELDDHPCDGTFDVGGNRLVCDGGFELRVTARDADGNEAELVTEIDKNDAS